MTEQRGAGARALVVGAALLLALWGVFLVPLRVGGTLVPVSLGLALLLGPLCAVSARLLGSRTWAVVPAATWLTVAALSILEGPGGDVLVPGGGALTSVALGALGLGLLSAVVAIATVRSAPAGRRPRRGTEGGTTP